MRHNRKGRQLSRDTEHRVAMRRNQAQSLFEHGSIKTTLPKAKELRGFVDKLISLAKKGDLHSRRRVISLMQDRRLVDENQEFTGQTVVQKLFNDVAPKFSDRNGGYTRIVRLGTYRIGDAGDWVMISLVDDELGGTEKPTGTVRKSAGHRKARNERRFQFAKTRGGKAPQRQTVPAGPEAAEEEAATEEA
ncbi:MAG: 50S ribosomal protein L17 [Planctomycetota bacterium]